MKPDECEYGNEGHGHGGSFADARHGPTLNVGLTEAVDTYVGYAGVAPDGPNTNFVEAGITVLPEPDTQLDLNTGLQEEGREAFFVGGGLARRFWAERFSGF